MKKILFLAYYYPPSGGAGVQRTVKFLKYLPDFGYMPTVVAGTGAESMFHEDPVLEKEVADIKRFDIQFSPLGRKIDVLLKTPIGRWSRTLMNAWLRAASRTVESVIEQEKPDILFVTASPFPAVKVIAKASQKHTIPWVLDLRDPWALDPITAYPTKLHYYFELRDMKNACEQANAVILNTPGALLAATSTFGAAYHSKFHCITNGWDSEDFKHHKVRIHSPHNPMKIVHTGIFHTNAAETLGKKDTPMGILRYSTSKINLLSRTPDYIFKAYRKLIDEGKISNDSIKFVFAGATTPADEALAEKYRIESCVEFTGYLQHYQSIALLFQGDVLFLPLHELKNSGDPLIVPGKTYEYLAAGKPILACVPKGDARDFVLKSGLGYVCNPSDTEHIAKTLFELLTHHKSPNGIPAKPDTDFIARFERRNITMELANVFNSVLKSG